ncbi:hypothetical protein ACU686_33115 [Yinghuangia aomiensis]
MGSDNAYACSGCGGSGQGQSMQPCPGCHGTGGSDGYYTPPQQGYTGPRRPLALGGRVKVLLFQLIPLAGLAACRLLHVAVARAGVLDAG